MPECSAEEPRRIITSDPFAAFDAESRFKRLFRYCSRVLIAALAVLGVGTLVAAIFAVFPEDWRQHFFRLLSRAWGAMTSTNSTNTPGFIFLSLGMAFAAWISTVAYIAWQLKRETGKVTPTSILKRALPPILFEAAGTLALVCLLYSYFVVRMVYVDHGNLASENQAFKKELEQWRNGEKYKGLQDQVDKAKQAVQFESDSARHWQESYELLSHGDTHPDRHLDKDDRRKLREDLEQMSKDPRNKDYIKIDFGVSQTMEASHLGFQIYKILQEAHWDVPPLKKIKTDYPKELHDYMQGYGPSTNAMGIYIVSDDPQKHGQYLALIFKSCCGLDVMINPAGTPPPAFKGAILWVGNKWFNNWRDDD